VRVEKRVDLTRRGVAVRAENVVDRRGEIIHPRTRDDDRVPPAVSFLGNAQESSGSFSRNSK
jgi:hypothetical protein